MEINPLCIKINDSNSKRVRIDFGDIKDMADSIQEFGLMHPLVVDVIPEENRTDEKTHILIAGERRLRAVCLLGWAQVPVTVISDTNEVQRKAMELEENVKRKDLHWMEQEACIAQLHELKQSQYGAADSNRHAQDNWGIRDTADLLNRSIGSVSSAIKNTDILSKRHDLREKVKKLPKTAAGTVLRRELKREETAEKVKNNEIKLSVDLMLGSCIDLIDTLEDDSVDMLLTDPPFGNSGIVNVGVTNRAAFNFVSSNVGTEDGTYSLMEQLIPKLAKKLKVGAHVYIFTGLGEIYYKQLMLLRKYGFLIDELPLIWHKQRPSVMARDYSYVSCYEACIFGHFGEKKKRLMKPVQNLFSVRAVLPQKLVHPLQRPTELLEQWIENSSDVGDLVLDCFAGSGSTLYAARKMKRRAVAFELDEGNYNIALQWLRDTEGENLIER
jgi:site-specific DNA-methyltransferase (adenine-specific)